MSTAVAKRVVSCLCIDDAEKVSLFSWPHVYIDRQIKTTE